MTIPHHLNDDLLVDYAAGTLSEGCSLAVACHLAMCPQCREPLKSDWHICPNCGRRNSKVTARIRCRVCSQWAMATLRTCPHCGAYLEAKRLPFGQIGLAAIAVVALLFWRRSIRKSYSG